MTLADLHVTFRGLAHSPALDAAVRERVAWLEQFYPGIMRCHVVVEIRHSRRRDGRHVHARIELTAPGVDPIVVSHEPSLHGRLKDLEETTHHKDADIDSVHRYATVAIHEAFDVARRRLEDVAREQRGTVKVHEVPGRGEIAEISPVDGYGFIRAGERVLYFHRASVLHNAFDQLGVGTPVAFVEEMGEKGPQASTVRVLGRHHYIP